MDCMDEQSGGPLLSRVHPVHFVHGVHCAARNSAIEVGKASCLASPPSEPCVRFSRTRLSIPAQVSLLHVHGLHDHSVSNHPVSRRRGFNTLPLSPTAFPPARAGPGFVVGTQTRRAHEAESSSSSYGLVIRLLVLSTPPCGDAVPFSYRPDSACLEGTSTPLTMHARSRTPRRLTPPATFCRHLRGWREDVAAGPGRLRRRLRSFAPSGLEEW